MTRGLSVGPRAPGPVAAAMGNGDTQLSGWPRGRWFPLRMHSSGLSTLRWHQSSKGSSSTPATPARWHGESTSRSRTSPSYAAAAARRRTPTLEPRQPRYLLTDHCSACVLVRSAGRARSSMARPRSFRAASSRRLPTARRAPPPSRPPSTRGVRPSSGLAGPRAIRRITCTRQATSITRCGPPG